MQVEQVTWTRSTGWEPTPPGERVFAADLVLVFGDRPILGQCAWFDTLSRAYPSAHIFGCSTAGEIAGTHVRDESLVVTALAFDRARVAGARLSIDRSSSFDLGTRLAHMLPADDLVHVLVLSDGLRVNGTDLVRGLTTGLGPGVSITGGLSGDGARFEETLVVWDGPPASNTVAAVGLYGELSVGCGSLGGWDPFGPERLITRADGNVLYELDGKSALELYKRYLGEHAEGLPATGLLFPLSLRTREDGARVVRSILSVDEQDQSLTFAGDMPVGSHAQLMKANFDRLIDGAVGAARASRASLRGSAPEVAILISCVGRKLVLKQRVEEEIEGVRDVLGGATLLTGFYSYGEISPFTPGATCELHNQTMTITTLAERG